MIRQNLTVKNARGLHARAAARLVAVTGRFTSRIHFCREGLQEWIDGKSILGILMMAASCGTVLNATVEGEDEEVAMQAIRELFDACFLEQAGS